MRDKDLDDALNRQPMWEPPAGFAGRVVAYSRTRNVARAAVDGRPAFDAFHAAHLAVAAATSVYVGTWMLWWLMPLVSDRALTVAEACEMFATLAAGAMAANAMWAPWASAACSLSVAAWFTRRAGVWG